MKRAGAVFVAASMGVAALMAGACTGDDPDLAAAPAGAAPGLPGDATPAGDDERLAPDAAPPAGCPDGCLPPAPTGWVGPSAVYDGPAETRPASCPALYPEAEVDTHRGLRAPPAACACGAGVSTGAKCTAPLAHSFSDCSAAPYSVGSIDSADKKCVPYLFPTARTYIEIRPPALDPGTCTFPGATQEIAPPTFEALQRACGVAVPAACSSRADCVAAPAPERPFVRLCLHKEGDVPCPSHDYAARFVAFRSVADDRGCGPCSDKAEGGTCGTTVGVSTTAESCAADTTTSTYGPGSCLAMAEKMYLNGAGLAPKGITCPARAREATGRAASTDPVTYCCNR